MHYFKFRQGNTDVYEIKEELYEEKTALKKPYHVPGKDGKCVTLQSALFAITLSSFLS